MTIHNENQFTNPQIFVGSPPALPEPAATSAESLFSIWCVQHGTEAISSYSCTSINDISQDPKNYRKFYVRTYNSTDTQEFFKLKLVGIDPALPNKVDKMQSMTLVPASAAMITTPYHPTLSRLVNNNVAGHAKNVNEGDTIWFWEIGETTNAWRLRPVGGRYINILASSLKDTTPVTLKLPVVNLEDSYLTEVNQYRNEKVNSFTLDFSVVPGPDSKVRIPGALKENHDWKITITFGDITCELIEGRTEITVTIGEIVYNVALSPAMLNKVSKQENFSLTFIPVWNGLLISETIPSSENWQDRVVYLRKTNVDLAEAVSSLFEAEFSETLPKFGENLENLPKEGISSRTGNPDYGLNIQDVGNTFLDTGTEIIVTFERCGGNLRFLPVYFAPRAWTFYPFQGENPAEYQDHPEDGIEVNPDAPELGATDCSQLPKPEGVIPIPIFSYYESNLENARTLIQIWTGSNPANGIINFFSSLAPGYRCPLEFWGLVVANQGQHNTDDGGIMTEGQLVFTNSEGNLTNADVPAARIRQVTVSRSLGGSSGEILWDRYDPITGLSTRPPQNVGGIRVQVAGGVNTSGGVIFTGLAMGNAETASQSGNFIKIPLYGRDSKLTDSEGGIRLLNAPFFDGLEHSLVMQWLCDYGGVPYENHSTPYKLPAGTILSPVIDYKTGTALWDALRNTSQYSSTIIYFDRFGVLQEYDVGQTTGVNWNYPEDQIIQYDDKPDLTHIRNAVVVVGLIREGKVGPFDLLNTEKAGETFQPMMVALNLNTYPEFAWSKMMFYRLPGIVTKTQLRIAANRLAQGLNRPRAAGTITIPGNANIELLDRVNGAWAVTSVSHTADTQAKTFTTVLGLEYLVNDRDQATNENPDNTGEPAGDNSEIPDPPDGSFDPPAYDLPDGGVF